jgi:hypothetical protein
MNLTSQLYIGLCFVSWDLPKQSIEGFQLHACLRRIGYLPQSGSPLFAWIYPCFEKRNQLIKPSCFMLISLVQTTLSRQLMSPLYVYVGMFVLHQVRVGLADEQNRRAPCPSTSLRVVSTVANHDHVIC